MSCRVCSFPVPLHDNIFQIRCFVNSCDFGRRDDCRRRDDKLILDAIQKLHKHRNDYINKTTRDFLFLQERALACTDHICANNEGPKLIAVTPWIHICPDPLDTYVPTATQMTLLPRLPLSRHWHSSTVIHWIHNAPKLLDMCQLVPTATPTISQETQNPLLGPQFSSMLTTTKQRP